MDETTIELKEYIQKLSPTAQSVIASSEWQNRLSEIGLKYSLNEKQMLDLGYEVLFVVVGMEPLETLTDNLIAQLGISRLLAEQVTTDVETRVIGYIIDMVEKKEKIQPTLEVKSNSDTFKQTQSTKSAEVEIRPNDLPMKESFQKIDPKIPPLKNIPSYRPAIPEKEKSAVKEVSVPTITQNTPVVPQIKNEMGEMVQRPISVPRVTLSSPDEVKPAVSAEPKPESIIDSKLHGIVKNPQEPAIVSTDAGKKYTVDPYREPIE